MAREPDRDLSEAFPVDKVTAAAEKFLHRDRFDADLLVSEADSNSDEDSTAEESSEHTEDSDFGESDQDFFRKKRKKKGRHKDSVKRQSKKREGTTEGTNSPNSNSVEPINEIETLIKKLGSISLEDPEYALLFYRATRIDPSVKEFIASPIRIQKPSLNSGDTQTSTQATTTEDIREAQDNTLSAPKPHQAHQSRRCFGCGEKGHGVKYCQQLATLVGEGRLTILSSGEYGTSDGRLIQRLPSETLIEALKREDEAPAVHFVEIVSTNDLQNIESVKQMKEFKNMYLRAFENSENEGSENGMSDIEIVESSASAESVEKRAACPEEGTAGIMRVNGKDREEDKIPVKDKTISKKRRNSENLPEYGPRPKKAKLGAETPKLKLRKGK
jgi:hypothetical protein